MTFYSGVEDEGHFVPNIPNTQSPHNFAPNVGLESEGFNVPSFANTPQVQSSVFDKTWPGNPIPLVPYDVPPAFQDSYTSIYVIIQKLKIDANLNIFSRQPYNSKFCF